MENLRSGGRVPVVLLTKRDLVAAATDPSTDRADEYLRKPFRMSDLLARVYRRVRPTGQAAPEILHRGGATFDRQNRRLTIEGRILDLTSREAALIDLVFRDADRELTAEQLQNRLRSLLT